MGFFDDLVENNIGYSSQLRKKLFNQNYIQVLKILWFIPE